MFGQRFGIGTAMGEGAGAAMAADELKFWAFGVPSRIARTKAASTTVKVMIVLFIYPPRLKVWTTPRKVETHLNQLLSCSQA
jgi:hypothetical protein